MKLANIVEELNLELAEAFNKTGTTNRDTAKPAVRYQKNVQKGSYPDLVGDDEETGKRYGKPDPMVLPASEKDEKEKKKGKQPEPTANRDKKHGGRITVTRRDPASSLDRMITRIAARGASGQNTDGD